MSFPRNVHFSFKYSREYIFLLTAIYTRKNYWIPETPRFPVFDEFVHFRRQRFQNKGF